MIIAGEKLVPDPSGVVYWPRERTLLVADMHLEKGSFFARSGQLLPPYDSLDTLLRLRRAIDQHQPNRVVCLGDSFHDADGSVRLGDREQTLLAEMAHGREWIWLLGNHDPRPPSVSIGHTVTEMRLGALILCHQALESRYPQPNTGEVSGHFHPKAVIRVAGTRIRRPCFVWDLQRLILPSFGSFTGGLNVLDPALAGLLQTTFQVTCLGSQKLYSFPSTSLESDV